MTDSEQGSLRERGKARRRRAVLDAARAIIRESGTIGFAMRALAQRAGVGEVTPYNLFGSKRGVLEAILTEELERYQQGFAGIGAEDELGALFEYIEVNMAMYRSDPQLYRVVLRDLMLTGDPSLRSFFSAPQRRFFLGLVENAVRAGYLSDIVAPHLIVRTLGRAITSCIGDWLWEGISLESLEANVGLGFTMALRGVATPRAAGRCDELLVHYQDEVIRHSRRAARAGQAHGGANG
jgi:AcrR family transcriptional regulator